MSAAFVLALFPAAARGQALSAGPQVVAGFDSAASLPPFGRARLRAAWFVAGVYVQRPSRLAAAFRSGSLASWSAPRATLAAEPRLPLTLESPADPAPASRRLGWMLAAGPRRRAAAPSLLDWASPPPAGRPGADGALGGPEPAPLVWDRRVGRLAREGAWWPQASAAGARADSVGSSEGLTSRLLGLPGIDELGWSVGGGAGVDRQRAGAAALDSEAPLPPDALISASGLVTASGWITRRFVDGRLSLAGGASSVQILDVDTAALAGIARARYLGAALRYSPIPALATGVECQVGAREAQGGAVDADGRVQLSTRIRF